MIGYGSGRRGSVFSEVRRFFFGFFAVFFATRFFDGAFLTVFFFVIFHFDEAAGFLPASASGIDVAANINATAMSTARSTKLR